MDVLIRITLVGALAILCYQIFSPFLTLTVWSVILAVTLYPFHQWLARRLGRKQWLASTTCDNHRSGGDRHSGGVAIEFVCRHHSSFHRHRTAKHSADSPAASQAIENWPLVGKKIYGGWYKAHSDLPGFVQSMQPKISELAERALAMVAGIGKGLLLFLASFIVAGILMAYGEPAADAGRRNFCSGRWRRERGEAFFKLTTSTIRAVASGVIGVAFIQAILTGLALMLAGVPAPGVLALVVLVLAIAQLPAVLVTIPAIIYIWSSGQYSTGSAITHTIILLIVGLADNVLKPLMLGRGVDVPMPVMLLGALGGMASGGILGMFVGATLFALGHQIFMGWVTDNPEADPTVLQSETAPVGRVAAAKT